MADKTPDVSPQDVANWLKENPTRPIGQSGTTRTTVPDAVKATGYTGAPLKIKEGNLTNHRGGLRLSFRGRSDYADQVRREYQALTTPDPDVRRAANTKIKNINQEGMVGDHTLTNSRLARGEKAVRETRGQQGVNQMRQRYQQTNPGYGHSPGNIQPLTALENGAKEVQERILDKMYQHLEKKPATTSKKFPAWEAKQARLTNDLIQNIQKATRTNSLKIGVGQGVLGIAPELVDIINNATDGAIDKALNASIEAMMSQMQKAGQSLKDFLVNQQPLGYNLDLTGYYD